MSSTKQGIGLPQIDRPNVLYRKLFASDADRARTEYLLASGGEADGAADRRPAPARRHSNQNLPTIVVLAALTPTLEADEPMTDRRQSPGQRVALIAENRESLGRAIASFRPRQVPQHHLDLADVSVEQLLDRDR